MKSLEDISAGSALRMSRFEKASARSLANWLSKDPYELFLTSSQFVFPLTEDQFLAYFTKNSSEDSHEFFSFHLREGGRLAGHCELKAISLRHLHGTIANVYVGPEFRGKRLGAVMMDLMLKCGFEIKKLHRIGLAVHTGNHAATSMYLRSGFKVEGTIGDVLRYEGQYVSLYQMAILSDEYERRKPQSRTT